MSKMTLGLPCWVRVNGGEAQDETTKRTNWSARFCHHVLNLRLYQHMVKGHDWGGIRSQIGDHVSVIARKVVGIKNCISALAGHVINNGFEAVEVGAIKRSSETS